MSRSVTSKPRVEKGSKNQIQVVTPVTHDIIAGKVTDQDWLWMLDKEDSESFISELVNEIYAAADKVIYNNYIEKQLVAYTVMQAKDALLQIVKWQFLSRDEGTPESEISILGMYDEEPNMAVTDCWAQGSVPLTTRTHPIISEEVESIICDGTEMKAHSERCSGDTENEVSERQVGTCVPDIIVESKAEDRVCSPPQQAMCTTERDACKKECPHSPPAGTEECQSFEMPAAPAFEVPTYADSCKIKQIGKSDTKAHHMDLAKKEDLVVEDSFDLPAAIDQQPVLKNGNCDDVDMRVLIAKIPPSRLPSNRVNTIFCIVDPKQEAARVRSDALRARRKMPQVKNITKNVSLSAGSSTVKSVIIDLASSQSQDHFNPRFPLLLDSMQVAAGVTAREKDLVKKGPKLETSEVDVLNDQLLRPIRSHNPCPSINVSDILDRHVRIKPLVEPAIVPPIQRSSALISQ